MDIEITIKGIPIAKARPQYSSRSKRFYNTQTKEESDFIYKVRGQWKLNPLEGPLIVEMGFGMPIAKSTCKRDTRLMGEEKICHTKKPDLSNLIKFVEDVLNDEVWKDDKQIYKLSAYKYYSYEPHTIIRIQEVR